MFEERVAAGDIGLFDHVASQTTPNDRRSLLALHHAIATDLGSFTYLEVGSLVGGTLQAFVADPRCRRIISIDPRPEAQPDDRGSAVKWIDNTTERMLAELRTVPGADLDKLTTIEASTEDIATGNLPRSDLCVIDGEHTYRAVLRDARFCRTVSQGAGVLVFHDAAVVNEAVASFVSEVAGPCRVYPLKDNWFVVEVGLFPVPFRQAMVAEQIAWSPVAWRFVNRLRLGRVAAHALSFLRRRRG
jgi:hypothetical protein